MEVLEGVVVGELKDLSHQIVKGKRTKRQRLSSPIPFTIASAPLSSVEGGGDSTNEEIITAENSNNGDGDDNNNRNLNNSTNMRLSSAGSFDDDNSTTTEDEEAARLLIFLSQGNSRESSTRINYLDHNYSPPSAKFTSKKYIETSSNENGKSGMFVYECKTCNRTFPSFQALGGHRASHKKPKNLYIAAELKKRPFSSVFSVDYDYDFDPSPSSFARNNNHVTMASPISYHPMMNMAANSPKIHECSYCGAEFTSGQALGGHMRRHRGSNGNNNSNYNYIYNNISNQNNPTNNNIISIHPTLALSQSLMSSVSMDQDSLGNKKQKIDNEKDRLCLSLSLDLNLPDPSPAENTQKNPESTEFEYETEKRISPSPEKRNEQQRADSNEPEGLVTITPTLVDCQY